MFFQKTRRILFLGSQTNIVSRKLDGYCFQEVIRILILKVRQILFLGSQTNIYSRKLDEYCFQEFRRILFLGSQTNIVFRKLDEYCFQEVYRRHGRRGREPTRRRHRVEEILSETFRGPSGMQLTSKNCGLTLYSPSPSIPSQSTTVFA